MEGEGRGVKVQLSSERRPALCSSAFSFRSTVGCASIQRCDNGPSSQQWYYVYSNCCFRWTQLLRRPIAMDARPIAMDALAQGTAMDALAQLCLPLPKAHTSQASPQQAPASWTHHVPDTTLARLPRQTLQLTEVVKALMSWWKNQRRLQRNCSLMGTAVLAKPGTLTSPRCEPAIPTCSSARAKPPETTEAGMS